MNQQSAFHKRLLRSQQGSVLLTTLIGGVVICIMFFASIAYIESQAKILNKAATKTDHRVVLDGVYAYTVNAIKQSWCLSPNWSQDMNCSLTSSGYTQRLLLTDETLLFIKNSETPHPEPLATTRLLNITGNINFSTLTNSHPLYSVVAPIVEDFESAKITIDRDSTAISAVRGREVPLRITVFLKHKTNPELNQTLTSRNIVYPRELTYFALIVSNNLNLGGGKYDPGTGNIRLDNIPVQNSNGGLRFESPVFVNGDLSLPPSNTTPAMNNVIFVDKVVLGGGTIKMDNAPYIVKTAGGDGYMYNYSMPNFAGMLGGFELDATRDTGLDYLFNIIKASEDIFDVQKMCRKRLMASYDLNQTTSAQLWVRPTLSETNNAVVQFNLGNIDNFIEQGGDVDGYSSVTNVPGVVANAAVTVAQGTPIMKAKVYYNGLQGPTGPRGIYFTEFYIHREGQVTLYPSGMGGASIVIQSTPLVVGNRQQYNQVDLRFTFNGEVNLAPYSNGATNNNVKSAPSMKFIFEAYDYGYLDGKNLRQNTSSEFYKKTNGVNFTKVGSAMVLTGVNSNGTTPLKWVNNSGMAGGDIAEYPMPNEAGYDQLHRPTEAAQNLAEFDDKCFAAPDPGDSGADYSAFPAAKWNTSFADQARHAWKFNPAYANNTDPGYNEGTVNLSGGKFRTDSLVANCVITADQTFITGFFVCEKLTINSRTQPLRIIGTVITNDLSIHPSAYTAGIRWSSIYQPQAVQELINAKILGQDKAGNYLGCSNTSLAPLWQSNIGVNDRYQHWICNPVSLRTSDPFKWTTVDPDCGIVSAKDSLVKCKKQTTRFLIKEVSRGKGL
ncbi:hypothetical protein ACLSU7_03730 [Bdellovibrio sp. HCB185ZH]|uniref:hypothetical protein n=1 Tax=Bdellovibrio sp. HCB185ZH TaxID=3394235 RepID=UPI0039A6FA5C